MTVEQRLDRLSHQRLDHRKECKRKRGHGPIRPHGRRRYHWKHRRDRSADIGYEAHDRRHCAPERCARDTDRPQAEADNQTETGVERHLRQQQAAETLSGIVERARRALKIAGPGKSDEAISQVATLREDEYDEHKDDACGRQRRGHGTDQTQQGLQGPGIRLPDLDRDRPLRLGSPWGRGFDLLAQVFDDARQPLESSAAREHAQVLRLLQQVALVSRQIVCKLMDLTDHQYANGHHREKGTNRHDSHCGYGRKRPSLQKSDERCEDEAQQHRYCDRYQDVPAEIQRGQDDDPRYQSGGRRGRRYDRARQRRHPWRGARVENGSSRRRGEFAGIACF